jgi:cobalamin biosynthesis Mg chelatase CobN
MNTHLENKRLKEGLTVGSMWNKHLNSQNKALEEERDRYRNMTFDQREQLSTAKEIIEKLKALYLSPVVTKDDVKRQDEILAEVEQFLKDSEVEK